MRKAVLGALVIALALFLTGCGSQTLDREIHFHDMTVHVSSKWIETRDNPVGEQYDSVSFSTEDGNTYVNLYFSKGYSVIDKDTEEAIEKEKEINKELDDGVDCKFAAVDNFVIDGAKCSVYEGTCSQVGESYKKKIAFVFRSDTEYTITGMGDLPAFDSVVKSIRLA